MSKKSNFKIFEVNGKNTLLICGMTISMVLGIATSALIGIILDQLIQTSKSESINWLYLIGMLVLTLSTGVASVFFFTVFSFVHATQ